MELSTFGAILGFAMEFEQSAVDFYLQAAKLCRPELFNKLARLSRKRVSRLERARRELISEMILEPISGISSDEFSLSPDVGEEEETVVAQAIHLEREQQRFYEIASSKIPIREVSRMLKRLAEDNRGRRMIIEG